MAFGIIHEFWSPEQAVVAQENFVTLFQKKDLSAGKQVSLPTTLSNPLWIVDLLKELQAVPSTSQAKQLIESGAVVIDGQVITEFKAQIAWQSGMTIKVGKHRIYNIA